MKQPEKSVSHELDLRDLIRVFWKRKVFLIVMTVAALILGLVISIFILPKQYIATASITVTPQPLTAAALTEKVTISDPFYFVKSPTKAEYLNRIKSAEVLQKVIDTLSLNTTTDALSSAITVSDVVSSELINITVIYSNPDTAKQIANTLCTVYRQYVAEVRNGQFAQAKDFADSKIEEVNSSYDENMANLEVLLDEHDIEAISADITRITEDIGESKTRKFVLETSLVADSDFVKSLQEYYFAQEGITAEEFDLLIETANSLSLDKTQIDLSISEDALSQTLLSYKFISAQLNLLSASSELAALEIKLLDLEDELVARKTEYYMYNSDYELLNKGLLRDKNMLLAYDQRKTEIETLTAGNISSNIINISSEATGSSRQASPNVIQNVLIATVFGLALGGAIVYFKDFWWVNTGTK